MTDDDHVIGVLRSVADLGLAADEPAPVRAQDALAREIELELGAPRRRRLLSRRPAPGSLVFALSTLVAVAIALAAVVLVRHRTSTDASSEASAKALTARLSVLRRPQTASDLLPPHLRLGHVEGKIVPGLTRFVGQTPHARLFLVVTTPSTGRYTLWSPALGDQVSILAVTGRRASQSFAIPAADLDNGNQVSLVGGTGLVSTDAYHAAVVPDGVARVRWTFADARGRAAVPVDVPVSNNVAYAAFRPGRPRLLRARWYAADDAVVPTSDRALRQAIEARNATLKAQLIRRYAQYSYHAAPELLHDFEVFSITSRTGARTPTGLVISHPTLASLPYAVVNFADPREPPRLDPTEIRQVTTPSGLRLWVIPGERGLCVTVLDKPLSPLGPGFVGGGGGQGCSGNLAQALAGGSGITSGAPDGTTTTYQVLPRSRTITIRTGGNSHRTFHPPYGIYVTTGRPRRY